MLLKFIFTISFSVSVTGVDTSGLESFSLVVGALPFLPCCTQATCVLQEGRVFDSEHFWLGIQAFQRISVSKFQSVFLLPMRTFCVIPHFPLQMPQEVCRNTGKQLKDLFQLQMTKHYSTLFSHRPAAHDDPSYSGIIHPIKSFKNLPHHSCWSHAQVQIGIWCMQLQYASSCSNLLQLAYRLSFVLWTQDSFCLSLFK